MRLLRSLVFSTVLMFVLVGCNGGSSPQAPQAPQVSQVPPSNRPAVPTPSAGMSIVYGQVVATGGAAPIKKTTVYLAQIHWDAQHKTAAYALDISRSPSATTDQNGFFTFLDVPPNEYSLVIGDFYGRNEVVRESNGDARIYQPTAGKTLDTGTVQVNPAVQTSN